jgi:hypothetical protein
VQAAFAEKITLLFFFIWCGRILTNFAAPPAAYSTNFSAKLNI